MKILERDEVLTAVKNKDVGYCRKANEIIDNRDYSRLVDYFPLVEYESFGFALKDGVDPCSITQKEWSVDTIIADLKSDLEFAIEKGEGQRGISANLMFEVINMWLWILNDKDMITKHYEDYGLSFYRRVENKYFSKTVAIKD